MSLDSRHVVVTGGGTGIGAATAQAFANAGAKVTTMGRTQSTLRARNLAHHICDVTDQAAVREAFSNAREDHGPIEVVVANAGAALSIPFAKMTAQDINGMLVVNLVGVFNCWQAGLADMKSNRWGRLIAIASTAGLKGYPYVSAYCAAKHGVVGLTRALALELGTSGITANAICPGYTQTPLLEQSIDTIQSKTGMGRAEVARSLRAGNPQDRFIQPAEVAQTALWLTSEGAASINGHALSVSGGEI